MSASISPWTGAATRESPDGRYVAFFDGDGGEVCMGGPLRGTLKIRRKDEEHWLIAFPESSASFVWSDDSCAIAVPRWTRRREHQLCVIRVPEGETVEMHARY